MPWKRNVSPNSPPRLGGVAAPLRKCSRSLLAQTGWYGMARSDLIDIRAALLIQSVRFANIYKVASYHGSTTPPFAKKRANGTPPNLGGESFAHLTKCPNSAHPFRMPRRYNRAPGGAVGKTRACSSSDTASSN